MRVCNSLIRFSKYSLPRKEAYICKSSISFTVLVSLMLMIRALIDTWKCIIRKKCINDEAGSGNGSLHQRIQGLVSLKPTLNVYIVVFDAY